ncbi:hypothetical protein Tco_0133493 [Tanacetum coccineum]
MGYIGINNQGSTQELTIEDMDRYPNACLEELEAFMTLWDVKPRVEESLLETLSVDGLITQLRQMCEDAEDRASNAQEEARQKRKEALEEVNSVPVPETALIVCTMRLRGRLHTVLEDMDRYPNTYLEELEAFLTLWDVKPRVEESSLETLSVNEQITQLRQMCENAEDRASNAQEEARQKSEGATREWSTWQIYRNNN